MAVPATTVTSRDSWTVSFAATAIQGATPSRPCRRRRSISGTIARAYTEPVTSRRRVVGWSGALRYAKTPVA
jgi:hypothetical protein